MAQETLPLALLGMAAGLLSLVFAAFVVAARPGRRQNQYLAINLVSAALIVATFYGVRALLTSARDAYALASTYYSLLFLYHGTYLLFLGTLPTPLTRPLRARFTPHVVGALALLFIVLRFLDPTLFVAGMRQGEELGTWWTVDGPMSRALTVYAVVVFLYAIAASVSAYRRAQDAARRRQMGIFTAAFASNAAILLVFTAADEAGYPGLAAPWPELLPYILPVVAQTVLMGLLTYGILKTQLLEIDLRLKKGLRRGTVVSVIVGAAFFVSEVARALVPRATTILGLVTAGVLVLAITRLNRVADRVADAVLPAVAESPDYLDRRKLELYRIVLEETLDARGQPLPERAAQLARLRERLGISDREHALILHSLEAPHEEQGAGVGRRILGRYHVEKVLGEGAHGRTYLAHDASLGRDVAIKAVRMADGDTDRIGREARALAALRHERIITVYDVEAVGKEVFVVMEHARGGSLAQRLAQGPLPRDEFARVASDLLEALAAVHEHGGVHRDVKPSNVLLTESGRAKLADFGIAWLPGSDATLSIDGGAARGTLRYMSPEQAKGHAVGPASDLYSAALTLFETLTGGPYVATRPRESAIELQMRVASAAGFDRKLDDHALEAWFARALDPDAAARFASAAQMRTELEAALQQQPAR